MVQFTEDALREVVHGYEASKNAALTSRDAQLREFHARGWRPVDLQRVTGYSRETIRQALHPEVREAANTSRRKAGEPTTNESYSARKPYVVADRLGDLHGPTAGTVELPAHLDWSGKPDVLAPLGWLVTATAIATATALVVKPIRRAALGLIERLFYAASIVWLIGVAASVV